MHRCAPDCRRDVAGRGAAGRGWRGRGCQRAERGVRRGGGGGRADGGGVPEPPAGETEATALERWPSVARTRREGEARPRGGVRVAFRGSLRKVPQSEAPGGLSESLRKTTPCPRACFAQPAATAEPKAKPGTTISGKYEDRSELRLGEPTFCSERSDERRLPRRSQRRSRAPRYRASTRTAPNYALASQLSVRSAATNEDCHGDLSPRSRRRSRKPEAVAERERR